jgi:hypothetical protein
MVLMFMLMPMMMPVALTQHPLTLPVTWIPVLTTAKGMLKKWKHRLRAKRLAWFL